MELAALIYFIDVFCGEHDGFTASLVAGVILWIVGKILYALCSNPECADSVGYRKMYISVWPLKTFIVLSLVFVWLLPTKDTAYKMLAAYGVQSIVTNPEVQKLGGKSLDVLNKAMDEYLQEDASKKDEKSGK